MGEKYKVIVIGSGFSGLSAACYLSTAGHEVHVLEKNGEPGGRARQLKTDKGFVFDMGPSWYWMPEVFENFFNDFGYKASDFYELQLLQPAFDIVFQNNEITHIPQNFEELCELFESLEKGSAGRLRKFMDEAGFKYKTAMENIIYKPGLSLMEFADLKLLKGAVRLQVFSSFSKYIRKFFSHPKLLALMEFPVLFLGAMPEETPALYSLMNYAGLKLGTWYPKGGFGAVVEAFVKVAKRQGVQFHFNTEVEKINSNQGQINFVVADEKIWECDAVIAAADYHHVEEKLLNPIDRNYSEAYWQRKTLAPSCLIFYLGLNKQLQSLNHHTLFFDEELHPHSLEIYKKPEWPEKPLFYVCCPSKTDTTVAPIGHENLFLLMPIAPALNDTEEIREKYFKIMIQRLEKLTAENISDHIIYKRSYCINDFNNDYNSFKGNAYGLANTLMQTAVLKPKLINYKIQNLFYAGQLTVPGPGVPPSIISGKIAAGLLLKSINSKKNEINI